MSISRELAREFQELAEKDKLSHAYLFSGDDADEVLFFSKKLAYFLETGAYKVMARPLSDTLIIGPDATGAIGIDAVRTAKSFLFSRPAVGKRRTVILDRGECLTPEAQNALLKIAEEPPVNALLIVNAKDATGFLPTLRSRFQEVRISSSKKKGSAKLSPVSAERFLRASSSGRSALIKAMLEEEEGKHALVERFLNELILALHKDMPGSAKQLGFVLRRKKLMSEYNTNMRLQLEIIAKVL